VVVGGGGGGVGGGGGWTGGGGVAAGLTVIATSNLEALVCLSAACVVRAALISLGARTERAVV
jgi:hypothetical protein